MPSPPSPEPPLPPPIIEFTAPWASPAPAPKASPPINILPKPGPPVVCDVLGGGGAKGADLVGVLPENEGLLLNPPDGDELRKPPPPKPPPLLPEPPPPLLGIV